MKSIKSIVFGIFLYLFLFYSSELFPFGRNLGWIKLASFVAVISLIFVYFISKGSIIKKMFSAFVSILIAFIISFIYSNIAYMYASEICNDKIGQEKSWNLTGKCANNLLPFPWGKKTK